MLACPEAPASPVLYMAKSVQAVPPVVKVAGNSPRPVVAPKRIGDPPWPCRLAKRRPSSTMARTVSSLVRPPACGLSP